MTLIHIGQLGVGEDEEQRKEGRKKGEEEKRLVSEYITNRVPGVSSFTVYVHLKKQTKAAFPSFRNM